MDDSINSTSSTSFIEQQPDIEMQDDGQLRINVTPTAEEIQTEATPTTNTQEDFTKLTSERDAMAKELESYKSGFNSLSSKLEQVIAAQNAQNRAPQPQAPQGLPEDFDWQEVLLDKQKGPMFIQQLLQANMQQYLGKIPEMINQLNYKVELDEFSRKNPEAFEGGHLRSEYSEILTPLLRKYPELTYEEAYQFVKQAANLGKTARQGEASTQSQANSTKTVTQAPTRAEVAEKMARLKSANSNGVSGSLDSEPQIKSVSDAFNAAWADVMGGRKFN